MAFTKITANVQNISALGDEPNVDDGLSASQLKAKFDKAGVDIKAGVNNLIDELADTTAAGNIGADVVDVGDTSDANVQAKLEYLQTEMQNITQGAVADGSITAAKLATDAVTTAKIEDEAVTAAKLDSSVLALISSMIETGTYTGTGTYGSANPTTFTFTKAPKAVLITKSGTVGSATPIFNIILTPNMSGKWSKYYYSPNSHYGGDINVAWSNGNKTLAIYNTSDAKWQFNENNKSYEFIALC